MKLIKNVGSHFIQNRVVNTIELSLKHNGGDDRILVKELDDGALLCVLADGATGVGVGYLASELFVHNCELQIKSFEDADIMPELMLKIDSNIMSSCPESDTTGLIVLFKDNIVYAVSAGDSQIYVIGPNSKQCLSMDQYQKPRIGSGICRPQLIKHVLSSDEHIVLCSDGLFNLVLEQNLNLDTLGLDYLLVEAKEYMDDDVSVIHIASDS